MLKRPMNGLMRILAALSVVMAMSSGAFAAQSKPNILVIMADDVGVWNLSAYHRGMMGGSTPNIDRIAKEGALFTDYYAQQSCTAGRASFITGQHPFRVGLLKVGLPGAKQGLQDKDPTIAELLKPHGYATAQIGKNHLGDRNEFLPTLHGFDEFFGSLYHLNAQEEPEDPDYPKNPEFLKKFGPRGVLDSKATTQDDPTVDPRFGRVGKQTVKDTGPLTRKRMETTDDELIEHSVDFMERSVKADKPFFLWHNPSRMHIFTRLSPKWENKTGYGLFADGMAELDHEVGVLLNKLDELKIADNTIVVFTSDNGAEIVSWPDGGNTPFKGEKGTTWEGGMRVPGVVRWPGVIKPGAIYNNIISQEDWAPTFLAAAGDPDVKNKLLKGLKAGDKTFKTHLDGYNFMPFFKGEQAKSPRREIFYFDDNASLNAVRVEDWKLSFKVMKGNLANSQLETPNMPIVINLRQDPFERYHEESMMYFRWFVDKLWTFVPAQQIVGEFIASFKEFPPSQKSGSFSLDNALESLQSAPKSGN
ncbi:MAG: arylsulfatase [Sulfuricellaceae bacterium]|nr:arylsulfatase [Sulfuricellaceae bacterium]